MKPAAGAQRAALGWREDDANVTDCNSIFPSRIANSLQNTRDAHESMANTSSSSSARCPRSSLSLSASASACPLPVTRCDRELPAPPPCFDAGLRDEAPARELGPGLRRGLVLSGAPEAPDRAGSVLCALPPLLPPAACFAAAWPVDRDEPPLPAAGVAAAAAPLPLAAPPAEPAADAAAAAAEPEVVRLPPARLALSR